MMSRSTIYDVAVVGFGPAGAVAAGLLGQRGITTYVCDQRAEVYDKPRAISLDHEILRLFQQMGVADRVAPYIEPFTDSVYLGVHGQVIQRLSMVPQPYPLAHPPSVVFTQPPVERVLRDHAASFDCVTIDLGRTLTRLEQQSDCVVLHVTDESGAPATVRARYLIGCDGASSTVRAEAGIQLEDLGFDEPWLVVDVKVNEKGLARLPATSMQYCNPARPATMVIGPGNHRRWEIAINPGEDPAAAATPEGTWRLLEPWLARDEGELWRQASYRFHALVADRWRVGRVLVAGDAAHQQPPFLGQGMCQGLRDVANLVWKLDAVLKGNADAALLDSYGHERKAHVIALTTRIKNIGSIITERDMAQAQARDTRLLAQHGGEVVPTPRQELQPALSAGLLAPGGSDVRGTIFPQPWVRGKDGKVRLDELLGHGWRVVLRQPDWLPALSESMRIFGEAVHFACLGTPPLVEAESVLADWFDRHGVEAAIVRPDHYLYGAATSLAELSGLLESSMWRMPPALKRA